MLHTMLLKTLRDYRRAMVWWIVGFVALAAYLIALFPAVRDNPAMQQLADAKLQALHGLLGNLTDFASPVGYVTAGLFTLMLPLMLLCFTIAQGANAVSGEEDRKTLELLLANPVSRSRVVLDKWGAMVLLTLLLGGVTLLAFVIGGPSVDLIGGALSIGNLIAGLLSAVLLALLFGTLALAVGAATGSRVLALSVAAGLAGANYLVKTMASTVESMDRLQKALPLYYYMSDASNPLQHGLNVAHAGVLVAGTLVLLAVAVWTFGRRDVAV